MLFQAVQFYVFCGEYSNKISRLKTFKKLIEHGSFPTKTLLNSFTFNPRLQ